jgi:hypothetical protein
MAWRAGRFALGVSPVSVQHILLHCPTGHLSAAVAGIAAGELPLSRPSAASLRGFYARALSRRKYGQINQVPPAPAGGSDGAQAPRPIAGDSDGAQVPPAPAGGSDGAQAPRPFVPILVMGRGKAGGVIDTALGQIGRVTAGRLAVRAGPALRLGSSPAGIGGLPAPAREQPPSARLRAALLIAQAATCLGWAGLADWAGASAAQACYGELVGRARLLPVVAWRWGPARDGDPGRSASPSGAPAAGSRERQPRALYHCFGATHSSLVAASLHTGALPLRGSLDAAAICGVPGFDARASSDIGRAVYMGDDEDGWPVFVIGFDGARTILTRAFAEILTLMPPDGPPVVLADTLSCVSPLVKVGGYLSRRLRLIWPGRRLAARGIACSAHRLRAVVADTRRKMRQRQADAAAP